MSKSMKRWEAAQFGQQNLELVTVEMPTPGPGQILVKVAAVALNFRDQLMLADGMGLPIAMPFTPASDMAGEVVGLGAGVSRFKTGDQVISTFYGNWLDGVAPQVGFPLGGPGPGMLAEYVLLDQDWAVAAPASLSAAEASTLPCAGLTAWFALHEQGALRAGQSVVVQGTGGVALFALQLAAAHGAQVIVTSSSDDKLARVKALGATHGINRRDTPDWAQAVLELTGGRGADHVLELAGTDLDASLTAAAQGGRVSAIGVLEGLQAGVSLLPLLLKRITVQGIGVGHRRALEDLVRAVDQLQLKPVIAQAYEFGQLPAALEHLQRGAFGKVVVAL